MEIPRNNDDDKSDETPKRGNVMKFRRILPQVIATTIKNFHMMDWGFTVGITTIMIPALTGILNERNQGEFLTITAVQSSWLVSISYATQMLGSSISGNENCDLYDKCFAMLLINENLRCGYGWAWKKAQHDSRKYTVFHWMVFTLSVYTNLAYIPWISSTWAGSWCYGSISKF